MTNVSRSSGPFCFTDDELIAWRQSYKIRNGPSAMPTACLTLFCPVARTIPSGTYWNAAISVAFSRFMTEAAAPTMSMSCLARRTEPIGTHGKATPIASAAIHSALRQLGCLQNARTLIVKLTMSKMSQGVIRPSLSATRTGLFRV